MSCFINDLSTQREWMSVWTTAYILGLDACAKSANNWKYTCHSKYIIYLIIEQVYLANLEYDLEYRPKDQVWLLYFIGF